MSLALPRRSPGSMIGIVATIRTASGWRIPPRTSGNAAIVPIRVARNATAAATMIEFLTASSSKLLPAATSYQCRVRLTIGRPGVRGSLNENRTRKAIGT